MTRTLITGATGFIGWRMAESWHAEGREILATGLTRNVFEHQRAVSLQEAGVPLCVGDLTVPEFRQKVLNGVETIVHLAAAQHEANVQEPYFFRINRDVTYDLLEGGEECGVQRFFYASTIGVYGANKQSGLDENTVVSPDNPYGRSKVAAEKVVLESDGNLQIFIGRLGETYGPGDPRLLKLFAGIAKGRFWLVGDGDNLHQPIHVDDLLVAVDTLLATPAAAKIPVILCGDQAITTRQMCESIAASLNTSLSQLHIPLPPLSAAATGLELILGKIGIQPPLHRRRLDFFRKSLSFSTTLRQRMLSLPPQRSFEEGARDTAKWYRDNKWL